MSFTVVSTSARVVRLVLAGGAGLVCSDSVPVVFVVMFQTDVDVGAGVVEVRLTSWSAVLFSCLGRPVAPRTTVNVNSADRSPLQVWLASIDTLTSRITPLPLDVVNAVSGITTNFVAAVVL